MRMTKKVFAITAALTMAVVTGCGNSGSGSTAATTAAPAATTAAAEAAEAAPAGNGATEITEAIAETPALLTSVGQSADVNVVDTLMKKAEIECDLNATVTEDGLDGYKTLILAIGGSSKGLGAAGIDENQELDRVQKVIEKAEANGMTIIALHIGGSARRGTLSDKFIPDPLAAADAAIIVSEGDSDGMMKGILDSNGTAAAFIDNQVGAIEPLKVLFGK